MKGKNHMIISLDAENSILQNSSHINDKNTKQSENTGIIYQHNKGHI